MANPTIGATTPRIQYTATGGQTAFTVPFEFLANADLAVYVNGTLQTLTTHYTLTGANTTGGGTCTFVSGRTAGDIVTIIGNLAYSRSTNKYTKFGLLPAEVLEADFDALQVQTKQLALADQFAIRAPMTDTGTPSMTLPAKTARADKALIFDANGNVTVSTDDYEDQVATVAASAAAAAASASASAGSASASSTSASQSATSAAASASSASAANGSAVNAASSASSASSSATSAATSASSAAAAASASGSIRFYNTKAAATADLSNIPADGIAEVFVDESQSNLRTRYRKESGVLVLRYVFPSGKEIYVHATAGSDSNNGRSAAAPFQTLAAAAAVLANGDTLYLARSCRWRETINLNSLSGVKVMDYGGGNRPIISAWDAVTSFAVYGAGPAYTFTIDLPAGSSNRSYPGVFEDRQRLMEVIVGDAGVANAAAAIAKVEATPGTFYFAGPGTYAAGWAAGTKTYYIHPTGSTNPNTNGKAYAAYKREWVVQAGDRNYWKNIVFEAGFHHDGLYGSSIYENCAYLMPARHGSLAIQAVFINHSVIGSNKRYGGGQFHSNPGTGVVVPPTTVIGARIIADPDTPSGTEPIAFFTHGAGSIIEKDGWNCWDVYVNGAGALVDLEDTNYGNFYNLKAVNFTYITSGIQTTLNLYNADLRMGNKLASNNRPVQVPVGASVNIYGSYIDVNSSKFMSQSGVDAGTLRIEDSIIITRHQFAAGNTPIFFGTEVASKVIGNLTLRRSTFYGCSEHSGYFAQAFNITSLTVDDIAVIGLTDPSGSGVPQRDPIFRLNSVNTPLSTLLPSARCIWQDPARVIETDDETGIRFKQGAYRPGMKIYSGIAFPGGATQPRKYVAVGDQIITFDDARQSAFVMPVTPSAHLNGVAFVNNTNCAYVAVGDSGIIWRSDLNGSNWVSVTSPTSNRLLAVAARTTGNVVAVGVSGTIIRSTDHGATWAAATTPATTRTMRAIATDGTTWIAAGDEGRVITSTDNGDTWTETTVGSTAHHALLWHTGLSLFLLGSEDGVIRTSPATISWTSRTTNTIQRVKCFGQGPDGVVAGLYQTQPHFGPSFITSSDGINWVPSPTTLPFDVRAVAGAGSSYYLGKGYMAVGESQFIATARSRLDDWGIRLPTRYRVTQRVVSMDEAIKETLL